MKKIIIYFSFISLMITACSKDEYYRDSGIHDPNFNGTVMEYLDAKAKRPIDLFDTLVQVIRYAGMEDVFKNEQITFFAAPDPSIANSLNSLNFNLYFTGQDTIKSFKAVKPAVWKYFLSQYIIKGDYGLIDFPQVDTVALYAFPGQLFQTKNVEQPLNVGVLYHDLINEGSTIKYKGPRQILVSYIPDFAQPKSDWVNTFVATSNIKPTNGRIHVLNYTRHSFGFDNNRFVRMAIEQGIDYTQE